MNPYDDTRPKMRTKAKPGKGWKGNYKRKRNWNKLRNNVRPTPTSKTNIKMYKGFN